MLKPRTIDRYVLAEILGPFLLGLGTLTIALVVARMLKLIELIVNHGITVGDVARLLGYIMPGFLELTFPMAVLLGVLLGFGRLSGDQELTAARACGISLYRLAAPVMVLALLGYALSSWLAFDVRPRANARLRRSLYEITRTRALAGLREKVFNDEFAGLVVYVDSIDSSSRKLSGVLISDVRNPREQSTIVARSGVVLPDEQHQTITVRLLDGSLFGADSESNATHLTRFDVYDVTIHPGEALGGYHDEPQEMSYQSLTAEIANGRRSGKRNYEAEAELASKYTVPLASVLFALLGISLGLKPARGGQSERFGISIALFFLYYLLMRFGQSLAGNGSINAVVAMAIPDLAFAALAVVLFERSARDRGDQGRGPGDFIWDLVERIEQHRKAA